MMPYTNALFKFLGKNRLLNMFISERSAAQDVVAFTARLSPYMTTLGTNQAILFNNVLTNIGNAYHLHGGIFTTPVAGVYVFFVTIMSNPSKVLSVAIVKNDSDICKAYGALNEGSGSCLTTVHLAVGDDVWVKHTSYGDEIEGMNWSSFSGILIHAD
jgi:hypothetical protein